MEIKQLLIFQTAAKELNFTRTAQMLGYAQSSITANITALETELGVQLFERLGKRVILTEAGRNLQNYADRILDLTMEASAIIGNNSEPSGILTICASETHCTYRLPAILKDFQEKYPKVELIFRPAVYEKEILSLISEGQIDVALLSMKTLTSDSLIVKELKEETMALICSTTNPLGDQKSIRSEDLSGQQLLLTEACDYRTAFEEMLLKIGVETKRRLELGDIEAIKQCVMADLGVAMIPEVVVRKEIQEGRIRKLDWEGNDLDIVIQMFWHKNKWISPALKAFIDVAHEHIQSV
ncbi:LysR family transcriptional regulator [Salinicoccus cyprini]|uniref:LysR family transcriptional regulator n=1 Tax=Salinicoccus cyprini TaxID=2493691 RepID=A0A558AXD9_9STAP|nr:LysR family transcriptional regulator [Salinicoccus cyprini]TVT28925.1 LysR family transcriptional regulator [Salinicoccus cyprini]